MESIATAWEDRTTRRRSDSGVDATARKVATGLGWFSIGLGAAELFASSRVATLIGARRDRRGQRTLQLLGAREFAAGLGILLHGHSGWLWSRVIGDVMDLAVLGHGFTERKTNRFRLAMAAAAVAGVMLLDAKAARQLGRRTT